MYIVIGGRGFLGSYLIKNISERSKEVVVATYHLPYGSLPNSKRVEWVELDITNRSSIDRFSRFVDQRKKETNESIKCIYVIGYIKPDNCIKNPGVAVDINIRALVEFLDSCSGLFDNLVFTSTDFVFNENKEGYRYKESDLPHPINFYGELKYACERIVLFAGFSVVRLPFMFGKSLIEERPHFIEHIEHISHSKTNFKMLSDYYENSLDYNTVANLIIALCEKGKIFPRQIIHICGDQAISKYEIALSYSKQRGLDCSYILPMKLADANFFIEKRATILMSNEYLKDLLGLSRIDPSFL